MSIVMLYCRLALMVLADAHNYTEVVVEKEMRR